MLFVFPVLDQCTFPCHPTTSGTEAHSMSGSSLPVTLSPSPPAHSLPSHVSMVNMSSCPTRPLSRDNPLSTRNIARRQSEITYLADFPRRMAYPPFPSLACPREARYPVQLLVLLGCLGRRVGLVCLCLSRLKWVLGRVLLSRPCLEYL